MDDINNFFKKLCYQYVNETMMNAVVLSKDLRYCGRSGYLLVAFVPVWFLCIRCGCKHRTVVTLFNNLH